MSKQKRRVFLSVGALSAGLMVAVTGCSANVTTTKNNTSSAKPSANTTKPVGAASVSSTKGTILYALPAQTDLNWFLPLENAATDSVYNTQFYDQLYKPLLWVNDKDQIDWQSSIASKITYNKQGTVYHVFMNPKWHWSNGKPVTTKDVLFTWNVIKAASAANAPAPWPFVGAGTGDIPNGVKSLVANGSHEFTITLDKPANQQWFIYNGIIQITPLPAAAWDVKSNIQAEIKYLGARATNPMDDNVVDGPFKIQSAVDKQQWTLVPNPSYNGHKSTAKKVVFVYEGSNESEFVGLKSGTINVGYLDLSQYGAKNQLTSMGDKISAQYPFGIFYTNLNMYPGAPTKKLFDQLYIRQALQYGIDDNTINSAIYHGYAPAVDGPIPTTPATPFLDPSLTKNPYAFSIAKGKKLLESHGWKDVNGVMTKGNQKLQFTMLYVSGSESALQTSLLMQQDWGQEGIKITLKPETFSSFLGIVYDPKAPTKWQIATGSGWVYNGPGFYPSGETLFASNASQNTGFSDKTEDALINASIRPYATQSESMKHFMAYEDYTAKALPVLWGQNVGTLVVTTPTVNVPMQYYNGSIDLPQMQYWTAK